MNNKGFADTEINIQTPKDVINSEKPLNSNTINANRVDINVLKSKLQENENKELKKNIYLLSTLIFTLGVLGVYLSF